MRPGQVEEIKQSSGMVFIPVSPRLEWHGPHLPLATDGIIAEEAAKAMAEVFDACYFRCLPLGLDQTRSAEQKQKWGLPPEADVFGMNFPGLSVESEYNMPDDMRKIMNSRLKAVKNSGFRVAIIVNHHGGFGQNSTLEEIAAEWSSDEFTVLHTIVAKHNKFHPVRPNHLALRVGGHAGLSETHQLMAFRPDLVDLDTLPKGELRVCEMGILNREPIIPEEVNPRNAQQRFADEWRESVLENLEKSIRQRLDATQ